MKTKTIITEITHDDLVDLFSTALYDSYVFGAYYLPKDYVGLEDPNDCLEDVFAKILLAGKSIYVIDRESEDYDDVYGELPHKLNGEGNIEYKVCLEDVKNGIAKALDSGKEWARHCATEFINKDNSSEWDNPRAEELIQWIIFGDSIYG